MTFQYLQNNTYQIFKDDGSTIILSFDEIGELMPFYLKEAEKFTSPNDPLFNALSVKQIERLFDECSESRDHLRDLNYGLRSKLRSCQNSIRRERKKKRPYYRSEEVEAIFIQNLSISKSKAEAKQKTADFLGVSIRAVQKQLKKISP